MATQRIPTDNRRGARPAATPADAWRAASDVPRQQMSLATESACAMFRGFESMRKIQEHAAHEALQHYSDAADKLRQAGEPAQWVAIQADLLRFDFEGATQYWQQLGAAAMDMQRELMDCCVHMVDLPALRRVTPVMGSFAAFANEGLDALQKNGSALTRMP